jgi:hypothetical protein
MQSRYRFIKALHHTYITEPPKRNGLITGGSKRFYNVQTGCGARAVSYPIVTGRYFRAGVKRTVREPDHSPPSSAEFKNGGAIPPLPHTSLWLSAWLLLAQGWPYLIYVYMYIKEKNLPLPLVLNTGFAGRFSTHLLRTTWSPKHFSSCLLTNDIVAPDWLASLSSAHSVTPSPPTQRQILKLYKLLK